MNQLLVTAENTAQNPLLAAYIDEHSIHEPVEHADIRLVDDGQGIEVYECHKEDRKPRKHFIDIEKIIKQQRSFPAPKQGAFNQALGKSKTVIDATGGWGGDALLMCMQGYQVTILERHSLMALLLQDAMQRLTNTKWAQQNKVSVPEVIEINAIDYFTKQPVITDCIYLDPMFPPKRKQSALANKGMQLLHELVGQDVDADNLFEVARQAKAKRVVVKRPDYAQPLGAQPEQQFSSKLLHYDVYF